MWQFLLLLYTGRAVPFESTWTTTTSNETIELPFIHISAYNIIVDWGDGVVVPFPNSFNSAVPAHTYTSPGNHNIKISGTVRGFRFHQSGVSPHKIVDIWRWGDFVVDSTSAGAFLNCDNLRVSASDQPIMMPGADLSMFFMNCSGFSSALFSWDCSHVVNMHSMFRSASNFDSPINFVNTSGVTDLSFMFANAQRFNQPLTLDTRNVRSIAAMFWQAAKFNSPLSFTTTAKIVNMSLVFCEAARFNQPLNWDTSNVLNMNGMFRQASNFNQVLPFSTGHVINMEAMFFQASDFNQPVNFDTQSVTNMKAMFYQASTFNQALTFNSTSVVTMEQMFEGATAFDNLLKFHNTSKVKTMSRMFWGAAAFGQKNLHFDTKSVTDMALMFYGATRFKGNLMNWDLSAVTKCTLFCECCRMPLFKTKCYPCAINTAAEPDGERGSTCANCFSTGPRCVVPKVPTVCYLDDNFWTPAVGPISGDVNGDDDLSGEACAELCANNGWTMAALRNGNECVCGDYLRSNLVEVAVSECNLPCAGHPEETCGGFERSTVFAVNCSMPPFTRPKRTDVIGCVIANEICYKEGDFRRPEWEVEVHPNPGRMLPAGNVNGAGWNSNEYCALLCLRYGHQWAGTAYGSECYCGHSEPRFPGLITSSLECSVPCLNANGRCGGYWRVNVFSVDCSELPCPPNYVGSPGLCRCAEGFTGTVVYVNKVATGCVAIPTLSSNGIAGVVIGCVCLFLMLCFLLLRAIERRRKQHAQISPAFSLPLTEFVPPHTPHSDVYILSCDKSGENYSSSTPAKLHQPKDGEKEAVSVVVEPIEKLVANSVNKKRTQFARDISEFSQGNRRYRVKKILGQGKFGVAFLVCDSKEAEYVVKVQPCCHHDAPLKEAKMMSKLPQSPHLLSLLDFFYHDNSDLFCIVLDYCSGGTLAAQVPLQLHPAEVWRILKELCTGLATLHEADIVHRDVKPDNIFLRDPVNRSVVLGDMGLARFTVDGYYDSTFGHKLFKAPEIQKGKFSSRSDMWAVGCVGFELLTGVSMGQRWEASKIIFGSLTQKEIDHELGLGVPVLRGRFQEVFSVVSLLLRVEPQERLSAIQVSEGLTQLPSDEKNSAI